MTAKVDIGQEFTRLKVRGIAPKKSEHWGQIAYVCDCKCGTKGVVVTSRNLRKGHTKSCGCLQIERVIAASTKHSQAVGGKLTQVYRIWIEMKQRCYNKSNKRYKQYGARGIRVCKRWKESFENFAKDMGPRPLGRAGRRSDYSLERINRDKDYTPSNCRWATKIEQARNRSNNILVTINGETKCLPEWVEQYGIGYKTVHDRLRKGWTAIEALTTEIGTRKRKRKRKT
jgi:hypothetical protein